MGIKLKVVIGKKYNRLTIIGDLGTNKFGKTKVLAQCDCGVIKEYILSRLIDGSTKSCGCYKKESGENRRKRTKREREEYVGKKYGRLTVVSIAGIDNSGRAFTICDCGELRECSLESLKKGYTTSCGCYQRENIKAVHTYQVKDYQEKHPLFCKVEEIIDDPSFLGILVRCKKCNEWFKPGKNQLWARVNAIEKPVCFEQSYMYCSEGCKYSCIAYNVGVAIFKNDELNLNTPTVHELSIWREEVLKRQRNEYGYNFCTKCQGTENLRAHHIDPKKLEPFLALDPENGIIFCRDCHLGDAHSGECSTGALAYKVCK